MLSNSMIPAIWRLFSLCSKPTQIKCLKHLIVGERAHVTLERAMGNCSVCVTHNVIIWLSITTEHHAFTAGLIPIIHLSRKHNKHKASLCVLYALKRVCVWWKYLWGCCSWMKTRAWWAGSRAGSGCRCCGEGAWPRCYVIGCPSVRATALAELSSSETRAPAALHLSWT